MHECILDLGFTFLIRPLIYAYHGMIYVFLWLQQVPHVNRTDYQLIDISEDGFVRFQSHFIFHSFPFSIDTPKWFSIDTPKVIFDVM